jgi:tetratricopeptide (TPR) repeat protein
MVLIQTGQLNEAISDFGKALTLNPKDAFSYSLRGSSYYLLGQYERAVADASKSIEIDPKQWAFYLSRAEAYIILGQLDLAQSDLNQSLKINAECAEAYFQLAFLLHKTGERDKAGSYFAKAEKLQPEILNRGEKIKKITKAAEVLTCHTEQLNVAKEYLYGDTSEDEPQQQPLDSQSENVVKVDIYRVITNPSEVKPGEEFELKTDFMVTDTTTSQNIVPFTLTYSVLEGEDVKIEVPNQYKATRGTRETQIIVLRASRKTGLYTIKVILQYKDKIVGQMTKITVK